VTAPPLEPTGARRAWGRSSRGATAAERGCRPAGPSPRSGLDGRGPGRLQDRVCREGPSLPIPLLGRGRSLPPGPAPLERSGLGSTPDHGGVRGWR